MDTNNQYTEEQIRNRYAELYPYDDPITIWEIRDLNIGADLDQALNGVYQARLSSTNKNAAEKREQYWSPLSGAVQRWRTSLENGTNPIIGLERVFGPAIAATAILRNPIKVGGAILGSSALTDGTNTLSQVFTGKDVPAHIADATGVARYTAERVNPITWLGGWGGQREAGRLATKYLNKMFSKLRLPIAHTPKGLQIGGAEPRTSGVPSIVPFYFSLMPERYIPEQYKQQVYYPEVPELTPERIDAINKMKDIYLSETKKQGGILNYSNYFK